MANLANFPPPDPREFEAAIDAVARYWTAIATGDDERARSLLADDALELLAEAGSDAASPAKLTTVLLGYSCLTVEDAAAMGIWEAVPVLADGSCEVLCFPARQSHRPVEVAAGTMLKVGARLRVRRSARGWLIDPFTPPGEWPEVARLTVSATDRRLDA